MNRQKLIGLLAIVGATTALGTGCVAHAQASGSAEAEAPVVFVGTPTLVAIDGGIWVVRDSDRAVYYVDDQYWVIRDGTWYRSRSYESGWTVVEVTVVPQSIVKRDHTTYVHYKGEATAQTKPAPRGTEVTSAQAAKNEPPAVGNPHGGPPGHDDIPGVGNQRKAEGEQPGHPTHTDDPAAKADAKAESKEAKADAKDAKPKPADAKPEAKPGPKPAKKEPEKEKGPKKK
jgi:hypothetical protein